MPPTVAASRLHEFLGREIGVSEWLAIDQDRINAFADATLDHQFIHCDPELAAQSPFGSTIAHGFLTVSLLSYLCDGIGVVPDGTVMGINYGFESLRFLEPVKVNDRIRARMTLLDAAEKKPGHFRYVVEVVIEIENKIRPALVAEWVQLHITD